MSKVMFIKPASETDAVWDIVRTSQPLGLWWLASDLKERGHEVKLIDETVRNNGLNNEVLFQRELSGDKSVDTPLYLSAKDFYNQKMKDFNSLTPENFVKKYSAFHENKIVRIGKRTGNDLENTLRDVSKMNPDFVGIPIFTSCNYESAISLAKGVKEVSPNTKVIFGGKYFKLDASNIVSNKFVDHVIEGDGLIEMRNLVEKGFINPILKGGTLPLEGFPLLDMDLIKENIYPIEPTHTMDTKGRKSIDYMFSKGCYRTCDFCVSGRESNQVFPSSFDKIDEQLQIFKDSGIEEIIVQDDAFLFKPKKVFDTYLSLMKNHGLYWQDNGGLEFEGLSNPEIVSRLLNYQSSGSGRINSLYIPINPRKSPNSKSAFEDMLKRNKNSFENIKQLKDSGVYVVTSDIVGHMEQGGLDSVFHDTDLYIDLLENRIVDKVMTFVTSQFPDTDLYDKYNHLIENKLDWFAYSILVPQSKTPLIDNVKTIEELTIKRIQELSKHQKTYSWGSPFPNSI